MPQSKTVKWSFSSVDAGRETTKMAPQFVVLTAAVLVLVLMLHAGTPKEPGSCIGFHFSSVLHHQNRPLKSEF